MTKENKLEKQHYFLRIKDDCISIAKYLSIIYPEIFEFGIGEDI
jgi:hypothetical protein